MEAIQVGPGFAAEMRGVTLADIINDDDAYKAVRAAFEQHSVLVFRDQDVSDESQLAFSRRFGPPEVTKVGSLGTGTHFVILTTIDKDGKVVPPDHRYAMRNKANQLWHTDSSFKPTPALTSVLSARIIPAEGGEGFDYRAKYLAAATQEICPGRFSPEISAQLMDLALRAHRALSCSGYSRTDFIVSAEGPIYLETNTLPGLTAASLYPKALKAQGIEFPDFLHDQILLAQKRVRK